MVCLVCDAYVCIGCVLLGKICFDVELGEEPEKCGSDAQRVDVALDRVCLEAAFNHVS